MLRKTSAKKLRYKIAELKITMRKRLHWSIPYLGKWLKSVIVGHCRYYGVPCNGKSLTRFRSEIIRMWLKSLRRRSQKHRNNMETDVQVSQKLATLPFYLPPLSIRTHARQYLKQEPSALAVRAGICTGGAE